MTRRLVRLWTLQPSSVWERLCRERTLWVDPADAGFSHDFREAYDRMRGQMRLRLPGYEDHYPWWAYDYKLELRSFRHQLGPGQWVRLELALPPERVLFSAYGAWHSVLNLFYLPCAADDAGHERESDAWDAELAAQGISPCAAGPLPEPWRSRAAASWTRIFDVEDLRDTNTIQACFERLDLADVVGVTAFTGVGGGGTTPAAGAGPPAVFGRRGTPSR